MNPDEKITIIWQGEEVGILLKPVPDMWYLEGTWVSNNSAAANAFVELAKALDSKIAFADLDKGIDVFLKSEDGFLRAIVISLTSEHSLFVRRMYYSKKTDLDAESASDEINSGIKTKLSRENIFQEIQKCLLFITKLFEK